MASDPQRVQYLHDRMMSLDFLRGVMMFFLAAEATGIYDVLTTPSLKGTVIGAITAQFEHHSWHGLHLWDLGQPLFMFISGAAMAFSYAKRWETGKTWGATLRHALKRSLLLFLLGWAIYLINPVENGSKGAFLYDVLPQLSLACLMAFLIMRRRHTVQIAFSLGLLVLTELFYRLWPAPGFNQPFIPDHNFGSYIDQLLLGQLSPDHWVVFNAVPLATLTIWGVVAGQLLRNENPAAQKIKILSVAALTSVGSGLALNSVTPIVRRISTSSFVLLAGGLALMALAVSFWLLDVSKTRIWARFFAIVGMNPLFIYLFTQSGGGEWLERIVRPFTVGLLYWAGGRVASAATSLAVLALLWSLCYWLCRRNISIRI